jgi:hypothetical protein
MLVVAVVQKAKVNTIITWAIAVVMDTRDHATLTKYFASLEL